MIRLQTLEQLRQDAGLTRAKVAADFDLSERHLYRLERGITPLRRFHALRFARYYGVSVERIAEANPKGKVAA